MHPWHRRRRRHHAPALHVTAGLVLTLLRDCCRLPPPLDETVLAAVMEARWSRATQLKQHLCLAGSMPVDLDHTFQQVLTPALCVDLVEDLFREGLLTRQQASVAQECVLAVTTKDGQWKNSDDPGPRAA